MVAPVRPQDLDKWWSDARYHRFRAAFQEAKRASSNWSDRKLHRGCEAIAETHAGLWVPSLSTVERFGETSAEVQNTLRGKPRSLSCLLIATGELASDAAEIAEMATEFARAFDFSAAPSTSAAAPTRRTYTARSSKTSSPRSARAPPTRSTCRSFPRSTGAFRPPTPNASASMGATSC
jgi:hypothetical protein